MRAAAAALNVAPATAHRWWHRWRQASEAERASRSCLRARPPVPKSCPWRLSEEAEQRILDARSRTNYGPARLAGLVGYRRSTVRKVLARHGCSRRRRTPKERSPRRYEWAEPGALLHMDTKRLQRFSAPGHWAQGGQREVPDRNRDAGYVYAHCVVDDHTRLAYVELHTTDTGRAAALTLLRAAAWMSEQGAGPTTAVMTDNAQGLRRPRLPARAGRARRPPHPHAARTPRWNGKVERFIQTLDDEWAHGRVWPTATERDRGLASWLRFYNRRRPHTSLGDRPPTSRVHQDRGQDI